MPIDYKEYHPKWSLISRLIRFRRAKNRCEWCGIQNYSVARINNTTGEREVDINEFDTYLERKEWTIHLNEACADGEGRWSVIVLTVAHIDHDKTNNDFANLAALCQRCHLQHDLPHHINNRKYGRNWKQNQLFLWKK